MTPIFIFVTTNGEIWVSNNVAFTPPGLTVLQAFRVNPDAVSQQVCTLKGSGNDSASALSCTVVSKSGVAEGNEIH